MLRRLFLLFPDELHAKRVVDVLVDAGVSERRIHAVAHEIEIKILPESVIRQKSDTVFRTQSFLWNVNLLIFTCSMIVFFITLAMGILLWIIVAFAVMVISFFAGEHFVVHVPDVYLNELTDALVHGEILLMVDVPVARVDEIENLVYQCNPDAAVGGVGWSIGTLAM